ncbi:cation:proton antiporter [Aspergillus novofumigatus IBT 16806]|uniref:Putative Na+/H+ antiporter n=1 Tax=Aspergillus novofumigatus (strain IBT 16806) TaxID=1392255 RepID=A0A2I1CDH3_ASPN1|nr:putative Na+/H+ antiporter [Aspergillus novofumigatus IBT 16806]PKX95673.1 putative Na+/H+ antiporter [Aspergillus novofumigatus IBT 16806]
MTARVMEMMLFGRYLAYHEPGIKTILIQTSFLLALNWMNALLDKLIYCGLIGQLLIGMAWGVPGANWLELDVQKTIQQLGYLGLLLLVYEGGLSTSFSQLKSNFALSSVVAMTGIGVPMALSFVLVSLLSAAPLQAFAAGASLCSTSIGTTFTILSTTGLAKTRLGVVLGSPAMMDDVAGLVMVQIIPNLGGANQESCFDPVVLIRPILVALGFVLGLLLICRFVVAVFVRKLHAHEIRVPGWMRSLNVAFVVHMLYLIGLQPKTEIPANDQRGHRPGSIEMQNRLTRDANHTQRSHREAEFTAHTERTMHSERLTGELTLETFCKEPLKRILSPLAFVSIGFSILSAKMFEGRVVLRGVVSTLLMAFGKLVTGLWLIRLSLTGSKPLNKAKRILLGFATVSAAKSCKTRSLLDSDSSRASAQGEIQRDGPKREESQLPESDSCRQDSQLPTATAGTDSPQEGLCPPVARISSPQLTTKRRSLYPASILGLAMVARGEIGYLIASLAEADGIFSPHSSSSPATSSQEVDSEIYLVVIWTITLCTFIGPLCVWLLVKRVKTLQSLRTRSAGEDPLGVWSSILERQGVTGYELKKERL